ncbi:MULTISPECIES: electron transfer flavoprotein subunit alpha/FixB family protein [unclassified Wenzhouxiangella]|uniref:electron transfer flavoprotein subunit alpha/FixB family protein n=1 Tax=unclassified Wenzhouxiangella TaxID=2613841 RepID=UPI000E3289D9|nr:MULTISPECIES: FAD-binding protein [unclassified Wenzhouxiangella]RFF27679.1 electron transfer flavoprotein subunit alpha/FixB family protein [Wenzhouxiangella sp. 15181]RFP69771.1 electron transfer flavoprotein subunit alpha/FixB family protein [Wenzhouxiangella sp. 15190]
MSRILIIAEHDGETLSAATAKTLTGARDMGIDDIDVAVFAVDPSGVAEQAAKLEGVTRVLTIGHADFEHFLAARLAPEIKALAGDPGSGSGAGYSHILMPSTTYGKDVLPRAAALIGVNQVSDIQEVIDERTFKRPIYASNAVVTVKVADDQPVVATIRTASFAAAGEGGSAEIESRESQAEDPGHTRFVSVEGGEGEGPDLATASVVVSGGRAMGSSEGFDIIYSLAKKLNAAVGASRAAVDAGYVPNELQVGQTGKIIAPELYFAIGISGAIQHLTGIKDAGTIVAINKDPEAPIFEVADLGLVGDLFELVPELEGKL